MFTGIIFFILILSYFIFFIHLIYAVFKNINTLCLQNFRFSVGHWASNIYPNRSYRTISQRHGIIALSNIPELGFSFLIYIGISILPDFFDRAHSLKVIHDIMFSLLCGIGFHFYLLTKGLSGGLLKHFYMKRAIELHNVECIVLLELLKRDSEKYRNKPRYFEERINSLILEIREDYKDDKDLLRLLVAANNSLNERVNLKKGVALF